MLPSVHPSLQPKQHQRLDRFSHFCTAHSHRRVSSSTYGRVLSAKSCSFAWGSGPPSNTCFLGPTRIYNPNGISIGSAVFAQLTSECRRECRGNPFPSKLPLTMESSGPHPIHGSLSPQANNPHGISISLSVFAGLSTVTDRQTDRQTYSVCNNKPHLRR